VKRKVIYVSVGRLTDKIARDWYIDYLIEKGVSVEYWDVVSLVREEHAERGARNPEYLHVFRSFDEVEQMLRLPANRDALYVMLITYAGQFTRIYRILSQYDCRMLFIAWGAMPRDPIYKWRKIASALANPAWCAKETFYRCKATALRRLKLVKPFDIIFAAGEALMAGGHFAAKVVPINLCDYDHYIKARAAGGRLFEGRYSVFLDINLPYQSDLAFCGYAQIDPAGYFRSLNRFFGLLERQYGLKVVIAAHPKADYDAATFEGRPMHRLVTAELVRDAEFVLSHTSTALSYAVLNAKPLVFIYTDGMAAAYRDTDIRQLHCYASYLDSPICNVDDIARGAQVAITAVNPKRYEKYKYDFLTTHESEQTSTGEIFLREISAIDVAETNAAQRASRNQ
jgi:hypothetical protein